MKALQTALLALSAAGLVSGGPAEKPVPISPLPVGDASVRAYQPCRLSLVSFRTPDEGWVSDMCGEIFRTRDAGRSWARDHQAELQIFGTPLPPADQPDEADGRPKGLGVTGHLEFMHWFDAREAIAGGYVHSSFFRTSDAGKTWTSVPVPSAQWVYDLFVRGSDVWACGSAGQIIHSADRGRSWEPRPSPFNPDDRCHAIQFGADHRGEATGDLGSVWSSSDDGKSWQQVRPPDPAERNRAHPTDLGKEARCRVGTLRVTWDGLELEAPGKERSPVQLRMAAQGQGEPMHFAERWSGLAYGLGARHFFLAEDGQIWHVQSELPPGGARRATFVTPDRIVLEADDATYVSESRGHAWAASKNADLDRADAARERGEPAPNPAYAGNPLECVARASDAVLTVRYGTHGCFGGADHTLALEVHDGKATVNGRPLDGDERVKLVAELGAALMRPEEPAGCISTTQTVATLSWACGAGPKPLQQVELESNACGSDEGVGSSTSFHESKDQGYARALGIYGVAAKADVSFGGGR